ncbi:hypothetical protein [Microbacterium sp.]|uniref:hypothetical protein n=1 Tax=Microbacterium sp. TaxID=51671 RepID=UPI0025DC08C9|nr:hypothetical protein [Microbacterium sp.]
MRHVDIATVRRLLRSRDDLIVEGFTARGIERAVAAGELHRVRRGWYMAGADWSELWPESRHLVHVVAVNDSARVPLVFALTSAAALHGLALYRVRAERVHTVHPDAARRSEGDVVRHRAWLEDADVVGVDGILCTSIPRTAYDLARLTSAEVALVGVDTALARIGGDPRRYDEDAAAQWLGGLTARLDGAGAVRGIRHARMLLGVADGRSQQPLEITTKLQLRRLGFRQPRLQVPVAAPERGAYWMDIAIDEADAFYECDGETKYTDEAMRSGKTLEQVLLAEKHREDWVRGVTGRRVLRGGTPHSATPAALAARLRDFHVAIPERRARLLLPTRPLLYGQ